MERLTREPKQVREYPWFVSDQLIRYQLLHDDIMEEPFKGFSGDLWGYEWEWWQFLEYYGEYMNGTEEL